jgi:hypothetical protein
VARIEWGEGVSCSYNPECRSHDKQFTVARAAAAALDGGSRWRGQGLTRAGFQALRGAFLHVVQTYGGSASRGTHLGWSCAATGTKKWHATVTRLSRAFTVVSGSS